LYTDRFFGDRFGDRLGRLFGDRFGDRLGDRFFGDRFGVRFLGLARFGDCFFAPASICLVSFI
jgi:hypothetical protein